MVKRRNFALSGKVKGKKTRIVFGTRFTKLGAEKTLVLIKNLRKLQKKAISSRGRLPKSFNEQQRKAVLKGRRFLANTSNLKIVKVKRRKK